MEAIRCCTKAHAESLISVGEQGKYFVRSYVVSLCSVYVGCGMNCME